MGVTNLQRLFAKSNLGRRGLQGRVCWSATYGKNVGASLCSEFETSNKVLAPSDDVVPKLGWATATR